MSDAPFAKGVGPRIYIHIHSRSGGSDRGSRAIRVQTRRLPAHDPSSPFCHGIDEEGVDMIERRALAACRTGAATVGIAGPASCAVDILGKRLWRAIACLCPTGLQGAWHEAACPSRQGSSDGPSSSWPGMSANLIAVGEVVGVIRIWRRGRGPRFRWR